VKLESEENMQHAETATKIPGIFSWFGYDLPIIERFTAIKNASFTNVSIWLGKEEESVQKNNLKELVEIASKTWRIV